jgi:hypothetical protein
MAENLNLQLTVDTSGAATSVGSLKKQLREAQNEVMALSEKFGATSKEAINAAKRAAELKDAIGDAKSLTDAFNPDAKFKALTASLSGVAGGFGAVQGAMALFGAESEDVQKTLLKVQSAMAISQGLQSVGESIDSFKQLGAVIKATTVFQKANEMANKAAAFSLKALGISAETTSTAFRVMKTAIISTGIGVLVIALGEAVSAFQSFQSAAEDAAEAQRELNASALKYADAGLKAEQDFLNNQEKINVSKAKLAGKSEEEIFKIEQEGRAAKIRSLQRHWKEVGENNAEARQKDKEEIDKINAEGIAAQNDFQLKQKKLKEDNNKQNSALRAQQIAEELAAQQALEDALLKQELDAFEKRQEQRKSFSLIAIGTDGLTKEERDAQKEEDAKRAEYFDAKQQEQAEKITNGLGKILAIKAAGIVAEEDLDKKNKKNLLDAQKQFEDAKYSIATEGLNLIGQLAGQGTAVAKAAALSQIVIDTGRGFASGLTIAQESAKATGPAAAFAFPIFYATQIAAVLGAVGKAKSILSQVQGGGGVGGSVTPPSISAAAPMTPQAPQAQTTNISQQSINQMGNQAVRAYVIESDVSSNQQRIEAIRQRARFS